MRLIKFGLHFWIALTSIISFLMGWIMLAHSPKPVETGARASSSAASLPTLSPLPALDLNNDTVIQSPSFLGQPSTNLGSSPVFRTGGS
jgi:hypothetical protein